LMLCLLQKEILLYGCPLATPGQSTRFLHRHPTRFFSPGPLSFSYPHNLSRDWPVLSPQSNSSEDPFLISLSIQLAPGSHYVWRPVLEARNCPGSQGLCCSAPLQVYGSDGIRCFNSSTSLTPKSSLTMGSRCG
jgi:hypothetical protein